MPDSIIDPLSDGNANGSSRGSSLGLNSTGDNQEQQVVTGVPPPGQPATAGNGEQTGIPLVEQIVERRRPDNIVVPDPLQWSPTNKHLAS